MRLSLWLGALMTAVFAVAAHAEPATLSAPEAYAAASAQEIILLDIRTPEEWKESGVAEGALPVTMHSPEFAANLRAILASNPGKPLALICATGGRSRYVASVLAQNGVTDVRDVSEGMFGNGTAPGWIARDLPIVDAQTAVSAAKALLP